MIGLGDLVRSECDTELDIPDDAGPGRWDRKGVDLCMNTFMSPRVTWRRQDLAEISVIVTATRQWSGEWYVYASVNVFSVNAFGQPYGGCIGDSAGFLGGSGQHYCQEADIETVAAAALEAAMTEAVDTPVLDPIEKLRWLAALEAPPTDLG